MYIKLGLGNMYKGKVAFLIFSILLICPTMALAENLFSWDFESEMTSLGPIAGFTGTAELSSEDKHSGSKSMKLTIRGNDNGNQPLGATINARVIYPSLVDGSSHYHRFWMKIDDNFSWGNGTATAKTARVMQEAQIHPIPWTGYIYKNNIHIGECPACNPRGPTINYDFEAAAGTGWHEYVVLIKEQTGENVADGEFHLWVDGQKIGGHTGLVFITDDVVAQEAWEGWMVKPYFQLNGTASDGGVIWIDDVSNDTEWNSIFPGTGDTTPPAPPTNLRVVE